MDGIKDGIISYFVELNKWVLCFYWSDWFEIEISMVKEIYDVEDSGIINRNSDIVRMIKVLFWVLN